MQVNSIQPPDVFSRYSDTETRQCSKRVMKLYTRQNSEHKNEHRSLGFQQLNVCCLFELNIPDKLSLQLPMPSPAYIGNVQNHVVLKLKKNKK